LSPGKLPFALVMLAALGVGFLVGWDQKLWTKPLNIIRNQGPEIVHGFRKLPLMLGLSALSQGFLIIRHGASRTRVLGLNFIYTRFKATRRT